MDSILTSEACAEHNQELRHQEPQFHKNSLAQEWQPHSQAVELLGKRSIH